MGRINVAKVVVGGLLAGLVINVSEFLFNGVLFAEDWAVVGRQLRRLKLLVLGDERAELAYGPLHAVAPETVESLRAFQVELEGVDHRFTDLLTARAWGALCGVVWEALRYAEDPERWGRLSWNRRQLDERQALLRAAETYARGPSGNNTT